MNSNYHDEPNNVSIKKKRIEKKKGSAKLEGKKMKKMHKYIYIYILRDHCFLKFGCFFMHIG